MVTDQVACDAEQPGSSIPRWVQAVGATQSLHERLGRYVYRSVADDTTRREPVDRTEVSVKQPLYRLWTQSGAGDHLCTFPHAAGKFTQVAERQAFAAGRPAEFVTSSLFVSAEPLA